MNARAVAKGLGWFSIGLGLLELAQASNIANMLGTRHARVVRMFGAREIATGIGVLTQSRKGPWIWARIVGDALDAAALVALAATRRGPKRRNATRALAAVSPIVALDVVCGSRLGLSA